MEDCGGASAGAVAGAGDNQAELGWQLEQQRRENRRLKEMLAAENSRVLAYQKKLKFIQDNQHMFRQLRGVYEGLRGGRRQQPGVAAATEEWRDMRRLADAAAECVAARGRRLRALHTDTELLMSTLVKVSRASDFSDRLVGLSAAEHQLLGRLLPQHADETPYATPRTYRSAIDDAF